MPVRSPRVVALAILVMSCGSRDVEVSCSPTLSCSLEPERFAKKDRIVKDAGRTACDEDEPRCPAEQIVAGRAHTCALTPAGELLCWGDDSDGQLGGSGITGADGVVDADGDAGIELMPVLADATAVAAGDSHSCGIDGEGQALCWGRNADGQVDGAPSGPITEAVVVEGIAGRPTAISGGGAHTCALVDDAVHCWGSASHGQIGRAVDAGTLPPGPVAGTEGAVQVSAGVRHTCARLADGHVLCWGELYDADVGAMVATAQPQTIASLQDAQDIAAGAGFTCARRAGGTVVCWGDNRSGQLGDGSTEPSATPVEVVGLELSLSVSAGGAELDGELVGHACAITKSFFAQCWGRNLEGQTAGTVAENVPRAVVVHGEEGEEDDEPFLPDVSAVAAGGFHTCSIDHDGPVLCWGDNTFEQLDAEEEPPFGRPAEVTVFRGEY